MGKQNPKSNITRYLITGIITILPLWVTLNVLWIIFRLISGVFMPVITPIFYIFFGPEESRFFGRLFSFFVTLFIVWLVGAAATNIASRRLLVKIEGLFVKVPILKEIYIAVRKLTVYIFTKRKAFKKVVIIEYPRRGVYSLAFVMATAMGEVQEKTREEVINVFLPSTPNPTTGFLLLVPKQDIIELEMSVDDAIKLIITGGIITPENVKKNVDELPGEDI